MDLGSKGQTPHVGARLKALDEAVLMAASYFSCNFFRILTFGFEQCAKIYVIHKQALTILMRDSENKIYMVSLQSIAIEGPEETNRIAKTLSAATATPVDRRKSAGIGGTNNRRQSEDRLAVVFMGIIFIFIFLHLPRWVTFGFGAPSVA